VAHLHLNLSPESEADVSNLNISCSGISPYPIHLMYHNAMSFCQSYQSRINTLGFPYLRGSIHAYTTFPAMIALNLDSYLGFHVLCHRFTSRFRAVQSVLGILKKKYYHQRLSIIHLLDSWLTTKLLTKCNLGADKLCIAVLVYIACPCMPHLYIARIRVKCRESLAPGTSQSGSRISILPS
jgi:hypothetical protein